MRRRIVSQLLERLHRDAERVARRFELRYRSIEAEDARVRRRYGVCYDDGSIRIRLFHAVTGRPLKYSSLVSTLCHELAHVRHMNHGKRFRALHQELLEFARREGIYAPGASPQPEIIAQDAPAPSPARPSGPIQLSLFG